MADMIYGNNYASTQTEWHGKGSLILPGDDVDTIARKMGLDFKIGRATVRYAVSRLNEGSLANELRKADDKIVLFREDTGMFLGLVSDGYKVMQPRDVAGFFREYAENNGMTLESGGLLYGGKRYFATAKLAEASQMALDGPAGKDWVRNYALLSSSCDGTWATEAAWKRTRAVCANTIAAAFAEGKAEYRVTHRSKFDPAAAKGILEGANEQFSAFMETARMLAGIRVTSKQAADLYTQLLVTPARDGDKVKESAAFKKMLALFNGEGKGSMLETSRETAWGVLNGCTEYVDHWARAHSDDNRFASAMWGQGDNLKSKALALLLTA